jgi:4-amino-4-deoxy-L-arabinose transferase-like glycosyltransferase
VSAAEADGAPRARALRFALLVAGLLLALRSAGFVYGFLNVDEIEFSLIGQVVRHGGLPYVDVVEFKPPLLDLLFVPNALFGGLTFLPMRLIGLGWVFATCLLLGRTAREAFGSEAAGRAATLLALLAGLCELPWTSSELLMNLPVAGALFFFTRAERSQGRSLTDELLCGLCAGLATLCKHQAAIVLVAIGLSRLWGVLRGERRLQLGNQLLLALGLLLPWALVIGLYARLGHLGELYDWVVLRNLGYASKAKIFSWPRALGSTAVCLLATPLPWLLAARGAQATLLSRAAPSAEEAPARGPLQRTFLLLLLLTWLPVSAGGRFYEHYFLQFVPPLALVAAPTLAALLERQAQLAPAARRALLLLALLPALAQVGYSFVRGGLGQYPEQDSKCRQLAAFVQAQSSAGEQLFVWGHAPQIYSLAQRRPGTRFLTAAAPIGGFDPSHLLPGFDARAHRSVRDLEALVADLEAHRVELLVDTAPGHIHDWDKLPLDQFPELDGYLKDHYRIVGTAAGALLYRRNPETQQAAPR